VDERPKACPELVEGTNAEGPAFAHRLNILLNKHARVFKRLLVPRRCKEYIVFLGGEAAKKRQYTFPFFAP
jgi:hypothetical protein